jgi:hypothetical protein
MPLWNSGAAWSSGQLWGPSPPAVTTQRNTKTKRTNMKRKYFYPSDSSDRPEWHGNFATKLQQHGAALGLTSDEINKAVADNLYLAYGLGVWITYVREYAPSCTSVLDTLARGTGGDPFVFPACTPPALPAIPAGVVVLPGALDRTMRLARRIKTLAGYTEAIGLDLGIVGSELPPPPPPGEAPPPELGARAIAGDANQHVRLSWFKRGHEYVVIESRRAGGAWEELAQSNKSPFVDDRPLLVAGQAEVRDYRARFWDDAKPSSDWCDVVQITVGP